MSGNAHQFLSTLSSKLLGVHAQVNQLQGSLNRVKVAIGGAFAVAGGTTILKGLERAVEKGNQLVKIQRDMAQAGVAATDVQEAYAKAWELTARYKNMGATEILKMINDARMTFGDQHHATHDIEPFVRAGSFLKAFQGDEKGAGTHNDLLRELNAALKSGEIAGKITPAEMAQHVSMLTAMRVAFGDQLKIGQYLTAQRTAGVAMRNTDDRFRYGMFPALAQENGPGAGVMLMTAFNKVVAGVGNRTDALQSMLGIGLLHKEQVKYDKTGRAIGLKDPNAILNNKEAAMNFAGWVNGTLKPLLDKQTAGLNGPDKAIREAQLISKMFPDRNAAKAVTEMLQQFSKLSKDADNIYKVVQAWDEYTKNSLDYQKQALGTQIENLMEAVGAPMVAGVTQWLARINSLLAQFSSWAGDKANYDTLRQIGTGIAALGAALTAGGAAALLAALGPTGWLVAGIAALGGAVAWLHGYKPAEGGTDRVATLQKTLFSIEGSLSTIAASLGRLGGLFTSIDNAGKATALAGQFVERQYQLIGAQVEALVRGIELGVQGYEKIASAFSGLPDMAGALSRMATLDGLKGLLTTLSSLGAQLTESLTGIHIDLSGLAASVGTKIAAALADVASSLNLGGMVSGVANAISSALSNIGASIGGMIKGAIGNINPFGGGGGGGAAKGATESGAPRIKTGMLPDFTPPRTQTASLTINHTTTLDGEVVARNTTRRLASAGTFPTSAGASDDYGNWHSPGAFQPAWG